jgi:hypothetical protein
VISRNRFCIGIVIDASHVCMNIFDVSRCETILCLFVLKISSTVGMPHPVRQHLNSTQAIAKMVAFAARVMALTSAGK